MDAPTAAPDEPPVPRRGDWVQTFTGVKVHPLDPRPEDVRVADVAHALARLCRFTGHVKAAHYSVAQHSVLASHVVHPAAALLALLHDAAEAYLGDLSRPLKRHLYTVVGVAFEPVKKTEMRLLGVILPALGWVMPPGPVADWLWAEVDRADEVLLATEARDLMAPLHPDWRHQEANGFAVLPDRIVPVGPEQAEALFLARFRDLGGRHPK
jgi:hypothetical protein